MSNDTIPKPKAFLCHGSEDKNLARRLAQDFIAAGIDTFFDEWEIRSGDSLRQKIDAGLTDCTHFLALLTPNSIDRPWVNAEMDAAFVRTIQGQCRFIPMRSGLDFLQLPPLLQGLRSRSINAYEEDVRSLIAEIHGVSNKPELGPIPEFAQSLEEVTEGLGYGLTLAASKVVQFMVQHSENGIYADPQSTLGDIVTGLGLPVEDVEDAVGDLEDSGFLRRHRTLGGDMLGQSTYPEDDLFAEFDQYFMPWNPNADAVVIAAALLNDQKGSASVDDLSKHLDWSPRRINPAVNILVREDAVLSSKTLGSLPFTCRWIMRNDRTRRFHRDHSP